MNDAVEIVGVGATIAAAFMAAGAIWQSGRQSERSAQRLIDERRIDFDLDLLKELAEILRGHTSIGQVRDQVVIRLRMLPPDELRISRQAFPEDADASSVEVSAWRETLRSLPGNDVLQYELTDGRRVLDAIRDEIVEAIRRRLATRD